MAATSRSSGPSGSRGRVCGRAARALSHRRRPPGRPIATRASRGGHREPAEDHGRSRHRRAARAPRRPDQAAPQDRPVDVRVSTVPVLHGESIVLRLLDKDQQRVALEGLGMSEDTRRRFAEAIQRPHGIVLATGPTGSGKTTTLYAAVDHIRTGREKILTVEDPVEYELAGVPQVPVRETVGLTFATALRSLLRQDPDVLLVGEIRDRETAEIATHAALTGHLVLSTLHTNDASGALIRLVDLGVAPFLVSATMEAVLAQRLVRTVCKVCVTRTPATEAERAMLGAPQLREVSRGLGCDACRASGYSGRTGVYELLVLDDSM